MIFETNNFTKESAAFSGADFTISKGGYENESLQLLKGAYLIANTHDYVNTNTKLFGYFGNYTVSGIEKYDYTNHFSAVPKYNGSKNFFGAGGEFGVNLNFKISSVKFGVGLTGGLATEFGEYTSFRKAASKEGLIESKVEPLFFTFSVFPILAYEISDMMVVSAQMNVGFPGFISPSIAFNNDNSVYWVSWLPDLDNSGDILGHRISAGFMVEINKIIF